LDQEAAAMLQISRWVEQGLTERKECLVLAFPLEELSGRQSLEQKALLALILAIAERHPNRMRLSPRRIPIDRLIPQLTLIL
jgi:hypothetical protein